jgi:cytochrome c biogenesis factor
MLQYFKNLFKGTSKNMPLQTDNAQTEEKSLFDFIFQHLDIGLLFGMCFMIYSIFDTFTRFVQENAHFIKNTEERKPFAFSLIFGLMFVEVLLSFATSYFRKRNEFFKSILVTLIAFVITYYNHITILEIFTKYPQAESIQIKMILCNWLIFGLGEVISLLMHSKGNDHKKSPLQEIKDELQHFKNSFLGNNPQAQNNFITDKNGNPITAQHHEPNVQHNKIGFVFGQNETQKREAWKAGRYKTANQDQQNEVKTLANQGTPQTEISQKTGLSVYIVNRIIKGKY